jgi:indole-3-glycerol phosphate synthase
MSGALDRILASKRAALEERKRVPRSPPPSGRDFKAAIAAPGLGLIAEIKHRSPSKGLLRDPFDPAQIASTYQRAARAISVLTDEPFFGGRLEHLGVARSAATVPLLAKDFVIDPYQIVEARDFGADAVLLIARALEMKQLEAMLGVARSLGMAALVEVHSVSQLELVLAATSADIIGINSRDLDTLAIDPALVFELAPRARSEGRLVVAESGLETQEAIAKLVDVVDAVLIGTALMTAPDIDRKLEELGFR